MKENKAYIGLGTNLGNREKNLETAISELNDFAKVTKQSKVYETAPVGYNNQGMFLNMTIELTTDLSPTNLIIRLHEIEHKMGRTREIKNGPRTIDLDILLYEDLIIDSDTLKIPHPRLHKREFVLKPLSEIAQNKVHPQLLKTIEELWINKK